MKNLRIYYQCVEFKKIHEFDMKVLNNKYHIICLTETGLNSTVLNEKLLDIKYTVFRRNRESSSSNKKL